MEPAGKGKLGCPFSVGRLLMARQGHQSLRRQGEGKAR